MSHGGVQQEKMEGVAGALREGEHERGERLESEQDAKGRRSAAAERNNNVQGRGDGATPSFVSLGARLQYPASPAAASLRHCPSGVPPPWPAASASPSLPSLRHKTVLTSIPSFLQNKLAFISFVARFRYNSASLKMPQHL